ncbi:unnamed protein product [Caenorhabditis bovis]|uniref:Myosin motor domain-containing protein n=1 Tax=Caenorhabditis bovis TaxID=2654633 RepID=A0A8S1F935_9PELO|nr:unnamed protein product [Caenorhabditis bovis]
MTTQPPNNVELDLLRAKTDYLNPALTADWAKKKLFWVPSEKDGFALASALGNPHPDGTIDVELLETGERQRVSTDDCQKPNPPKYDKCEDMAMLTGESGAGKTENTKKVIQYLAYVAGNRSLAAKARKGSVDLDASQSRLMCQLEEQLLQANPILEAFGNSKTVKNDNSSRFGKFIRIHFDATGCISGANIEFYLLEKSRVLKQAPNERTFHIFYQMLKGLSSSQKESLLLEPNMSTYKFISNGDCKLAGVDDSAELKETIQAMNIMGLNDEEINGILRVVSAVLLFGNLEFSQENKNTDQAMLVNDAVAQKIASLLGVNVTELMKAFLKPKIKVQRDLVHRSQNVAQAKFSVGAIAKACYERLFRWLVHRLNKSLDRTRQLVLSTLDDVCLFPQGSDASFVQKLVDTHSQHPKYVVPEIRAKSDFAIVHYAGRVDYEAAGWRVKNMDPLNENVIDVLRSSKDVILGEMWKDVSDVCSLSAADSTSDTGLFGTRVPKKGMFRTVSQLYKEQLARLMSTLSNTNPHFVRCIIPNHEKRHGVISSHLVLDQLRCNGVLEGIRICRQGFPTRLPFQEFRQRYEKLLTPEVIPAGFMDGKEAVRRIVEALDIDKNLYRIGQSKIFFRAGVIAELEEERDQKLSSLIEAFQAHCRGWLGRRILVRRREQQTAIRIIQRNGLAWMRLREWQWWRLLTKVKPLLEVTNKDELIAEKEQELKITSERLRRSEIFIADVKQQMEKMDEERAILKERLDAESLERAEIDEERARIVARKNELQTMLEDVTKRLESEEKKAKSADEEKRKLMETVRHLEESLEGEERMRQKSLLEKNSVEARLKEIEVQMAELEDSGNKLQKEKKALEERCENLSSQLIDEQERSKQFMKTKTRLEALVAEQGDELEKEKQQRVAAETARRAAESQLREEQESCLEKTRKAEELLSQLTRKEAEMSQINLKNDEEIAARQQLEREIRELRAQLDDALEEVNKEKTARQKAEKARRDMAEELEGYKQELEESNDKTVLHSQLRAKRDEEYAHLQKQLEETIKASEESLESMKVQNQKKLEELMESLDQLQRQKASSDKAKATFETDIENVRAELANVASARQEAERRRKAAESQLMDKEHKMRELQTNTDELVAKLNKINTELESMQKAKDSETTRNANLLKKIASLDMQLTEMTEASEEDRRNRTNLQNRIRQLEDELVVANELREEAAAAQEKAEKEAKETKAQLLEAKKRLEDESKEKFVEIQRKKERELVAEKERADAAEQAREKAERAKKKAIQEAEDAQRELTEIQAALREMERKQRKFDQQLSEERNNTTLAQQERDSAQQMLREAETRNLVIMNDMSELKDEIEQLEKERRTLRLEVDNLSSTKDDAGKSVFELEKAKRRLEEELNKAEQQIIDLEDALQLAEDAKSRMEINLQAARHEHERQLSAREEDEEDRKKTLIAQNRTLSEELEAEQRARAQAVSAKKKLEAQLSEFNEKYDEGQRQLDEMARQLRKAQLAYKEVQLEASEARTAMDDALAAQRDAEKRARNMEDEIKRLNSDLSAVSMSRRKAEAERDELLDELETLKQSGIGNEEKRRLEARIADLEDQLDEETAANDLAQEKIKKAQQQVEQMTTDLAMERSLCERNESERNAFERANRELKQQLQEAETNASSRMRTQLSVAEAKIVNLEQQISLEEQDRLRQSRTVRRLESRLAETTQLLDEEKRQAEQHKLAADRLNARIRQLRNQLEDVESERDRLNNKLKEERRRAEDLTDANETLSRDFSLLKQRETTSRRTPSVFHRESRRFGSNTSISREDLRNGSVMSEMSPAERPASRLTSGTGSQPGNTDEDHDSVRN